jgi:dipeptidase
MFFAKNSDRDSDEVQNLCIVPAADHDAGETVKCTYIEIPQADHTHEVFLSKPYWMFGAEMGANEHGVVAGNESLFMKVEVPKENKYLLGMDLLRLGLERGTTAKEALDTIIALLEKHGQGGNHGHSHPFYYNNSMIIADPAEAYVLETMDRFWAWKRITTRWTISNVPSITTDADEISPGLVDLAVKKRWAKSAGSFNFKANLTAPFMTRFAAADARRACTWSSLEGTEPSLPGLMVSLRSHGENDAKASWNPLQSSRLSVCGHATGFISRSQTTGSMVAWCPRNSRPHVLATGSSTPCTSAFTYVYGPDARLPDAYKEGEKKPDLVSDWWAHERWNRVALLHYEAFKREVVPERDALEKELASNVPAGTVSQDIADAEYGAARDLLGGFAAKYAKEPADAAARHGAKFLQKLDRKTGLSTIQE